MDDNDFLFYAFLFILIILLCGCASISKCVNNTEKAIDSCIEEHYHYYWK